MTRLCILLGIILMLTACDSVEYRAQQEAPCRTLCQQRGGFFGIAHVYTGGFSNHDNKQCVCNDGTTIPRPN